MARKSLVFLPLFIQYIIFAANKQDVIDTDEDPPCGSSLQLTHKLTKLINQIV